ncbi:MAG: helix-turn-helix transcriptional regulator [Actinobacteria bacterium]|nr:helix-turn-helix transcriptional regulator [Actinomycetota bacterium]
MSVRNIILGLLREQPGNSYEVVVRFDRRVGPWEINRGQVYRTVSDLNCEGLVEEIELAEQSVVGSRGAKFWRITDAGERVLDTWLASPCESVEPMRGDLLARLAAAGQSDVPDLLVSLDLYEREILLQLEADIRKCQAAATREEFDRDMIEIIYDCAMQRREAEINWVRRARELLQGWAVRERSAGREPGARRANLRESVSHKLTASNVSDRAAPDGESAIRRVSSR